MTTHHERPVRFLLRCARCKTTKRRDLVHSYEQGEPTVYLDMRSPAQIYDSHYIDPLTREPVLPGLAKCTCGRVFGSVFQVAATMVANVRCGARCRNSKGPTCECSCGGTNHGSGYGSV